MAARRTRSAVSPNAAGMIIRPLLPFKLSTVLLLVLLQCVQYDICCGYEIQSPGTGSRAARKEAQNSIPSNKLTAETKQKLAPVVEKPSIFRRLPVTSITSDPEMFVFLIRQPEVVVNIWQLMGVTQMSVERTGDYEFLTNDGAGAISNVELVYGTNNQHIFYAEGSYAGPLLKRKLKGRAVMILNTNYAQGPDGKPITTNSLDVFLKVENATVSLVAKTLNPIIGPTADHNFVESLKFVQRLNETTEKNGTGVQRMAYRLTNLSDGVRDQFIKVAGTVYERNSRRTTMKPPTKTQGLPTGYTSQQNPTPQQGSRRMNYQDFQYGFK